MFNFLGGEIIKIDGKVQLWAESGSEAIELHGIIKEVVIEDFGKHGQQFHINGAALEDGVDIGTLAMQLPGQFAHGHAALVEDRFDKLSDMHTVVYHNLTPLDDTKKAWKIFLAWYSGFPRPPNQTSHPRQTNGAK